MGPGKPLRPAPGGARRSCERCHGSGIAHVEAQSAGGDPGPIFHPGKLSAADQVAFCGQCHRQPTDFEPREILARDPLLARHAGASLMMSACFRESDPADAITCTECHDPHLPEPAGPARTRAVCSRCHEDVPSLHRQTVVAADSDCAGCHLPTQSEAFHGTPFTDHWIRLPGDPPTPASAAGRRELAWLEELYGRRMSEENPPAKWARLRTGLAELLHIRGARSEAQALLTEALERGADYETRLKAGALFRDGERIQEALELFREAAAERPNTPHAHYELGETLLQSGDFASAVGPLTAAAELSEDSAGVQAALGAALHGADRPAEAIAAFRDALRIEPGLPAALGPLAGILAAHPRRDLRRPAEAVRLAERLAGQFAFQRTPLAGSLRGGPRRGGGLHRRDAGCRTRRRVGGERRRRRRCRRNCATPRPLSGRPPVRGSAPGGRPSPLTPDRVESCRATHTGARVHCGVGHPGDGWRESPQGARRCAM